jgi:hypothetical protein
MNSSNHIIVFALAFFMGITTVFADTNVVDTNTVDTNTYDPSDVIESLAHRMNNFDPSEIPRLLDALEAELENQNFSNTTNVYRLVTSEEALADAILNLQQQKADTEAELIHAQYILTNVTRQIQLLHLPPNQLKEIEDYNKSINPEPNGFFEWLCEKRTTYELIVTTLVAIGSFLLGAAWDVWREGRKKTKHKTPKESK